MRFEPVKGYRFPVVRVWDGPLPLFTLSFTEDGEPINPPPAVEADTHADAWQAWKDQDRGAD